MKHIVVFFVFLAAALPIKGRAEEVIQKGELLNLQRCVEIALKQQPAIISARNTTVAFKNRIGEAKANYYPQINGNAGYSRISFASSRRVLDGASSGQVIGSTGTFNQYTAGFSLSQNIYDFGRTSSQVGVANLNYSSSVYVLENVTDQIILDVRQSYYAVLRAKRSREVNIETVRQFELHLEQAKGFFEVGTKPRFDVTKAEVDLSNARLNLIRAGNTLRIAIVNLNNAMGLQAAPEYDIEDNLSFSKYEISLDEALSRAFENRHDLRSAVARRKAAEITVSSVKAGYYPFLTGNASYDWTGEKIDGLDHGWTVGATLTFPVFSGFLTKYQVEEARANVNALRADEESLRQTVLLEVQEAYLNLKEAEERIPTAELAARQAGENFEIANGRYAAGVGNPIEVTDAQVALSNAKTAHIEALYDYRVDQASLEKAMGMR